MIDRVFLIVLDGVGIGELPDAQRYGDIGSDTIRNTARAVGGLNLPVLESFGLGCLGDIEGVPCTANPVASYGRMAERSPGKDTTTGHWEIAGLILDQPFPVYPKGFPEDLLAKFTSVIGREIIGNEVASGTEIIMRLGDEHVKTGKPIVYTSADSVFQIAAHEDVITVDELYKISAMARALLTGEHAVGRVIARPFSGSSGNYARTARRKDFSLTPIAETMLDRLCTRGFEVYGIGKIDDIFANRGLTGSNHTTDNAATLQAILERTAVDFKGLVFANCIDFDMLYGHRNDYRGFAQALERVDAELLKIRQALTPRDLMIITADHGVDPTTPSTDHSREHVPLLAYCSGVPGVNLGTRNSFGDIAATIMELFGVGPWPVGESFANVFQHHKG